MKEAGKNRIAYVASDFVAANISWLLFTVVRYFSLPVNWMDTDLAHFLVRSDILLGQAVVPFCMVILYLVSGAYNKSKAIFRSRLDEVLNTVAVSAIATLGIYFTAMIDDNIPERLTNYELILILFLLLAFPDVIFRLLLLREHIRRIRSGCYSVPALVLGVIPDAEADVRKLVANSKSTGICPVACVSADGSPREKEIAGLPVYGFDEVQHLIRKHRIGATIVICYKGQPGVSLGELGWLYQLDMPIYITPDAYSVSTLKPRVSSVVTEPLVDINSGSISATEANLKRISDVIISTLSLALLSPLFLVLALCVRIDSPGPVFYRQERIGLRRKPFHIVKFRSMRVDAEKDGPRLSSEDDVRITRFGRTLRRFRLDELPQFWNVLKGDMSLVGPRPERPYYVSRIMERLPAFGILQQVRPGITSWGMVKFGYASTIDQMVERATYDLLYINNVSLGVDLKILFHTVNTVLRGRGK